MRNWSRMLLVILLFVIGQFFVACLYPLSVLAAAVVGMLCITMMVIEIARFTKGGKSERESVQTDR